MIDRTLNAPANAAALLPRSLTGPAPSTVSAKGPIGEFLEWFGDLGVFLWQVVRAAVTPPFEFRELFRQLDEIGSKSLPLVALAGGIINGGSEADVDYIMTH